MPKPEKIGDFEEICLLAIINLQDSAYGMSVRKLVAEVMEKPISIPAIYTTLERLEHKDLIVSTRGEASEERGGRPKRYFTVTDLGKQTLIAKENVRRQLVEIIHLSK